MDIWIKKSGLKFIHSKVPSSDIIIHTWSERQSLHKGMVVNPALSYLHGGSLEITLTVPLRQESGNLNIYLNEINVSHNL